MTMPMGTSAVLGLVYNGLAVASLLTGAVVGQALGNPAPGIEYGALGLCVVMTVQNFRREERMSKALDLMQKQAIDMTHKVTTAVNRNSAAMETCYETQMRAVAAPKVQT